MCSSLYFFKYFLVILLLSFINYEKSKIRIPFEPRTETVHQGCCYRATFICEDSPALEPRIRNIEPYRPILTLCSTPFPHHSSSSAEFKLRLTWWWWWEGRGRGTIRKGREKGAREQETAVKSPGKKARASLFVRVARLIVGFGLCLHGGKKGKDDVREE